MTFAQTTALSTVSLFVGMLVLSEVGRRAGRRKMAHFRGHAVPGVYVIVNLEYPRLGLIRVDTADQILVELQDGIS